MPKHNKWSIGHIFTYGFAIAGVAGALLIWSIYQVTTTIMATATSVSQTYEVISSFRNLQERLIDAETAERGFVITGDPSGLPAYQTALQLIQSDNDLIGAFVSNYPGQKVRFIELQKLIAYRLKTLQMIVDTRAAGGVDASHELVSLNEDKLEMKRIRGVLMQMEEEENIQLNKRLHARDVAYREFWWSFIALIVTLSASTMWQ
jgi:methyl-accepting chemotaxis protein